MSIRVQAFLRGPREPTVIHGRLAVRARAPVPGRPGQSAPVPGLTVRSETAPEAARFHAASGLYGFLGLGQGTHVIRTVDPEGRYLPSRSTLTLDAGPPPTLDLEPLPAIGHRFTAGDTILWGQLGLADGTPAPLARIEAEAAGRVFVTHADLAGLYVLWLRGLRPPAPPPPVLDDGPGPMDADPPDPAPSDPRIPTVTATLRLHRFRGEIPATDPVLAVPPDFRRLSPGDASSFDAVYAALGPPVQLEVPLGRRTRHPPANEE